jgi:hypothetical protein
MPYLQHPTHTHRLSSPTTPPTTTTSLMIVVVDFGSQLTQNIARRIRELSVCALLVPFAALQRVASRDDLLQCVRAAAPDHVSQQSPQLLLGC